jgi:protein SCO1
MAVLVLACSVSCQRGFTSLPVEPPRMAADLGGLRLSAERGKVLVITFGYTSCPDVCPLTLSRLKSVYRVLGRDAQRVATAFVTVDPERDRPDRLSAYVAAFDRRITPVFLEGPALDEALAAYGVTAVRRPSDSDRYAGALRAGASYSIDHSAGFYVVDTRGRLRLRAPDDIAPEALAQDLSRLLRERPPPRLRVEAPEAHLTPSGLGAGYLRIVNPGAEEDRLLGGESTLGRVELHESIRAGTVVRMLARPEGFRVPARGSVELARGGKHLMLVGMEPPEGARTIPVVLRFERSAPIAVELPVDGEP